MTTDEASEGDKRSTLAAIAIEGLPSLVPELKYLSLRRSLLRPPTAERRSGDVGESNRSRHRRFGRPFESASLTESRRTGPFRRTCQRTL
jgi:hypothetical protein